MKNIFILAAFILFLFSIPTSYASVDDNEITVTNEEDVIAVGASVDTVLVDVDADAVAGAVVLDCSAHKGGCNGNKISVTNNGKAIAIGKAVAGAVVVK